MGKKTILFCGFGSMLTALALMLLLDAQGRSQLPPAKSPATTREVPATRPADSAVQGRSTTQPDEDAGPFTPCGNEAIAPPGC